MNTSTKGAVFIGAMFCASVAGAFPYWGGGGGGSSTPAANSVSTTTLKFSNTPAISDIVTVGPTGNFTSVTPLTGVTSTGGWVIDSSFTWTALGSSSFTITGDMTSLIGTGTKVGFTNNSAQFYAYISTFTYGTSLSTGTIDVNSAYTMAVGAITSPQYSNAASPVKFPDWLTYVPSTTTGFSVAPTATYRYREEGRRVDVQILSTAAGTSNANTYNVSLPVTSAAESSGVGGFGANGNTSCEDASAVINTGVWNVIGSTNTVQFVKSYSSIGWTASGSKACSAFFSYER